jgi:glutamate--cysteine ligase
MTHSKLSHSLRLRYLIDKQQQHLLCNGLKGVEKESLRISKQGSIATTPHPSLLGSALTHPSITTDYSEALLEFITAPFADIKETLNSLHQIHQFVIENLEDEMLLATSMPCGINGDKSIPIAAYGDSNIGKMKQVYRQGLAHRYGRTMQSIAGIHFNILCLNRYGKF